METVTVNDGTGGERAPAINEVARRLQITVAAVTVGLPFVGTMVAIAVLCVRGVRLFEIGLFAVMYVVTIVGVEVGLHRHFAHGAFVARRPLRGLLVILGSMSAEGPLIWWVATHRRHHALSDQQGDPHSPHLQGDRPFPALRGFWHAHVGWMFAPENGSADWARYAPDLLRDRGLFTLHRLYPVWVLLGLLLPAAAGGVVRPGLDGALSGLLWGGFVRLFVGHHVMWSVGSFGHLFGRRPFATGDYSANNAPASFLSFGGCWQNDHHAFPSSARYGLMEWWQIDLHYWIIRTLAVLGLVRDVRLPSARAIQSKLRQEGPAAEAAGRS
jgi:stearoyl-CoA desaturase (delta-9 desaturase)